jgi:hypothetical protein
MDIFFLFWYVELMPKVCPHLSITPCILVMLLENSKKYNRQKFYIHINALLFVDHQISSCTRCQPKVPEIRLPKLNPLSKFLFASISLEVVPFCVNTAISAGFPWLEARLEVILRQHLHHVLRFSLDLFSALKTSSPLEPQFHFWK